MFLNCGAWEDFWVSLGLQGDPTSQSTIFIGGTNAEAEALILWPIGVKSQLIGKKKKKKPWCWDRLRAGGEEDCRGWDGRMTSLTQWTWTWTRPGRQWRTGKSAVLYFMGPQRVGHVFVTEQHCPLFILKISRFENSFDDLTFSYKWNCSLSDVYFTTFFPYIWI